MKTNNNNTALALDTLSTEAAVLRALCATGCVGVGGVTEDWLLSDFEYIDRVAHRAALTGLLGTGHVESVDLPLGTVWTATRVGAQSVGHRRW